MGTGRAEGENRAVEAAKAAISSPLLEDVDIAGSQAVLVNVLGREVGLQDTAAAMQFIQEAAGPAGPRHLRLRQRRDPGRHAAGHGHRHRLPAREHRAPGRAARAVKRRWSRRSPSPRSELEADARPAPSPTRTRPCRSRRDGRCRAGRTGVPRCEAGPGPAATWNRAPRPRPARTPAAGPGDRIPPDVRSPGVPTAEPIAAERRGRPRLPDPGRRRRRRRRRPRPRPRRPRTPNPSQPFLRAVGTRSIGEVEVPDRGRPPAPRRAGRWRPGIGPDNPGRRPERAGLHPQVHGLTCRCWISLLGGGRSKAYAEGIALLEAGAVRRGGDRLREAALGRADTLRFPGLLPFPSGPGGRGPPPAARRTTRPRPSPASPKRSSSGTATPICTACSAPRLGLAGDWDEALGEARAALRLNPDYVEARLLEAAGPAAAGPAARGGRQPERPGRIGPPGRPLAHRAPGRERHLHEPTTCRADLDRAAGRGRQRPVGEGRGGRGGGPVPGRPLGGGPRTFRRPGAQAARATPITARATRRPSSSWGATTRPWRRSRRLWP